MRTSRRRGIRLLLALALAWALAGVWSGGAWADETLCRADVKLKDGSTASLENIAVQENGVMPFTTRNLLAQVGEETREIVLNRLRFLDRLGPSKQIELDTYYQFNYKDQEGSAGVFWLRGDTEFVGNSTLGSISIPVRDVKTMTLNCPPPIKIDGKPEDMQ